MHLNINYEQNKEKRFADGSNYAIAGNGDSHNPTAVIRRRTQKKNGDSESTVKSDADINKKSASQKLDQDNFCYRGEKCQQANQGQQIVGRDNEAKGFNDQSENLAASTSAGTGTGNENGNENNANVTACIACFENNLPPEALILFKANLARGDADVAGVTYTSIEQICLALDAGTLTPRDIITILQEAFRDALSVDVPEPDIIKLLQCLALLFPPTSD